MIKVLFTIPNFDTAGSGLPLIKLANNLNKNIFITEIACLHKNGDLFQDKVLNHFKVQSFFVTHQKYQELTQI